MDVSSRDSVGSPPLYRVILAASIGNTLEWFDFLIYGYFAVTISKLFFPTGNETVSLLLTLGTFGASYRAAARRDRHRRLYRPRRPQGRTDPVDPADDDRHDNDRGDADLRDNRHCRPDHHSIRAPVAGLFGGRRVRQRRRVCRRAIQGAQRICRQLAVGQPRRNGAAGICLRGSADRCLAPGPAAGVGLARPVLLWSPDRAGRSLHPAPHDRDARIYRRRADRDAGARPAAPLPGPGAAGARRVDHLEQLELFDPLYPDLCGKAARPAAGDRLHRDDGRCGDPRRRVAALRPLVGQGRALRHHAGNGLVVPDHRLPGLLSMVAYPSLATAIFAAGWLSLVKAGYSGVLPSLMSELFPTETRGVGVSLSYSISVTIFGGFAPFVATWLIAVTGDSLSPSFYLMFTAGLSIIALMVVRQWESRGELRQPETAAEAT